MPCFDPEDVIFITNKWDAINQDDSDSEDEEARTWEKNLFDIKSSWPQVTEKNIFKMSLKEVRICFFMTLYATGCLILRGKHYCPFLSLSVCL